MLIAVTTSSQFLPLLSPWAIVGLLAGSAAAALLLGWLLGPSNPVAQRWSLWGLRGAILLIVVVVILNPVKVDQLEGPKQHPEMFYLVDASASMQMGNPRSRWDQTLTTIRTAHQQASDSPAVIKPFRFGQRLAAIERPDQIGLAVSEGLKITPAANTGRTPKSVSPTDGDTRLQAALRQISSRFSRVPPQGIVLFSDGRVHDETGLEQIAAEFKKLKVPIHVVPVGDMGKGGDVAIAAVVAPPKVRKYTEVEVQVFVRSFGYEGQRSEVRLMELENGREGRQLASLPITLQSGYQSVSLTFRADLATRKLRVTIPTAPNEVSDRNNQLETEMGIERTKIRVLYVEGSAQPMTAVRVGDRYQYRGPFSDLKQALTDDEDIECVVLAVPGGIGRPQRIAEYAQVDGVRGFPTTVAELSAFDAIILSDVAAESFTEKQLEWIEQWIGQRGGGLCMVGGEHSFASGGWEQTPLAAMLPVEMLPGSADWVPGETIRVVPDLPPTPHPLWTLVADEKQNRQIAETFPVISGVNRWAGARPNLTTVLATTAVSGSPVAVAQPAGGFGLPLNIRSLPDVINSLTQPVAAPKVASEETASALPAIVAGRYGKGRTLALAFPITSPSAEELVLKWGQEGDNRYYGKFARNLVYWLTENSAIGRRRLVASADKRFYRPGESITVRAATYDESAAPTKNYRVTAMVEPHSASGAEADSDDSPLRWPAGMPRESGEEGPFILWGEEFTLPLGGNSGNETALPLHAIQLPLAEALTSGASSHSLRVELTAYEDQTQVDSTSLDIQILHDPFEQQNPFPDHELLGRVAAASGGKVLRSPGDLATVLKDVPVNVGPPIIKRAPLWSNVWIWGLLIGLLTVEWCWRRTLGLA
jgi:uncharacterized membrane protein